MQDHPNSKKFAPSLTRISELPKNFRLRKYRFKYISHLQILSYRALPDPPGQGVSINFPGHMWRSLQLMLLKSQINSVRIIKNVKYIANLQHNFDGSYPILDSVLSQKRTFTGNLQVSHIEEKAMFFKKIKSFKSLEFLINSNSIQNSPAKLFQTIKGFPKLTTLQFTLDQKGPFTPQDLQTVLSTGTRKHLYSFKAHILDFANINYSHFPFNKLQALHLYQIAPIVLELFLLRARDFKELQTLSTEALEIKGNCLSEIAQNFALFPKLTNLKMGVELTDSQLSQRFLAKFTVGTSLKKLHLFFYSLHLPTLVNSKPNDYLPFKKFAQNLGSAKNLENLELRFHIVKNFIGINRLLTHLPMNLTKVKKLSLELFRQIDTDSQREDLRIFMKLLFQWAFSMPQLKTLRIKTLVKDYEDLSELSVPETLTWKTLDISCENESRDLFEPNEFRAFMEILTKAQRLECLALSIQDPQFSLEAYNLWIESLKVLKDFHLQKLGLKLNCWKFSRDDLELIGPALAELNKLSSLSLMFIVDKINEASIWEDRLCKFFEKYQQLPNFNLALAELTNTIFLQSGTKLVLSSKGAIP